MKTIRYSIILSLLFLQASFAKVDPSKSVANMTVISCLYEKGKSKLIIDFEKNEIRSQRWSLGIEDFETKRVYPFRYKNIGTNVSTFTNHEDKIILFLKKTEENQLQIKLIEKRVDYTISCPDWISYSSQFGPV